ncbi:hypothetical protein J1N35_044517 [Gossypium stocksii]|uniref:RNase H type-1 domain-containing protein n=1 Tax=Gossypium stocksii TaxID=47602 RepID=A0A9D3U9N2_9ROSI|nr:hypothetical protein J1N35_044517 [Gossypium stocksii]
MFAAVGGLLRDHNGNWIVGFIRYLDNCEVINSKLWGILDGWQIALDRGFWKVIVRMDNLEGVNLIHEGVRECFNSVLVRRILLFLKLLSHWNLQHIPEKENRIVDRIVKLRRDRKPRLRGMEDLFQRKITGDDAPIQGQKRKNNREEEKRKQG